MSINRKSNRRRRKATSKPSPSLKIGWRNYFLVAVGGVFCISYGITSVADPIGVNAAAFFPVYRSAEGLANEAALAAAGGDLARARNYADRAVSSSPLDQPAARQNVEVELLAGNEAAADRKLRLTALLGWRDMAAQSRLMILHAQAADIEATLNSLDALQRRAGVSAETQQVAVLTLSEPAIANAFLQLLQRDPPWRQEMFVAAGQLDATGAERFAFALQELQSTDVPPKRSEIDPVLNRLVDLGEGAILAKYAPILLGAQAGKGIVASDQGLFADIPRDSDTAGSGPFAWKRGRAERTTISMTASGSSIKNTLYVRTRSRVPAEILTKNMILAPGLYRLSYREKLEDNAGGRPFEWTMRCGSSPVPVSTSLGASQDSRQNVTAEFVIPSSKCPAQVLALKSTRNLSGNSLEGEYADMQLNALAN